MILQVWKPEFERPGRHFVYTSRYTRFFVKILEQLSDRASLEGLSKRVRKRAGEFHEHADVWQEICTAYLKVLRRYGSVPVAFETTVFSGINHDEFLARKEPLEKWCQDVKAKNATLEVLRDAIELKKTNGSLMKPGAIDDLIGDAYAYLYDTIGLDLWKRQTQELQLQKEVADAKAAERKQANADRNPMMSLTHLMNLDGANADSPSSTADTPTGADAAVPSSSQPDAPPAAARRKVGVGRREIRLCADACVSKPAPAPLQAAPSTTPRQRVQIIIPSRKELGLGPAGNGHDSGDDESELSDIDEDVVNEGLANAGIRPMFPGLLPLESRSRSESGDDADEDGPDDDDEAAGDVEDELDEGAEDAVMGEDGDGLDVLGSQATQETVAEPRSPLAEQISDGAGTHA